MDTFVNCTLTAYPWTWDYDKRDDIWWCGAKKGRSVSTYSYNDNDYDTPIFFYTCLMETLPAHLDRARYDQRSA